MSSGPSLKLSTNNSLMLHELSTRRTLAGRGQPRYSQFSVTCIDSVKFASEARYGFGECRTSPFRRDSNRPCAGWGSLMRTCGNARTPDGAKTLSQPAAEIGPGPLTLRFC